MKTLKNARRVVRAKKVGVKDLKNNLSAYLRDVRRGTRILVTDRATITAELHEPGRMYAAAEDDNPTLAEWIEKGVVVPAQVRKRPLPRTALRTRTGTAQRLIDQDREEGP